MAEIDASDQQESLTNLNRSRSATALAEAISIMARLRAPDGCPWDREQTFDSIKRYTLEETYEVFDAIERRAWPDLKDELGDLLLQVFFYSQMASEAGYFDIADVAENLNAKLIRRHPHVFPVSGQLTEVENADAVLRNWDQIKREEKEQQPAVLETASALDDIPRTMPATLEAGKLGSRAAKAGFDWPDSAGIFAKVQEELSELQDEMQSADVESKRIEEEFGDLLFTVINLSRHLKIDPESALRQANKKFRRRFQRMETVAGGFQGLKALSADDLDGLWNRAKQAEA